MGVAWDLGLDVPLSHCESRTFHGISGGSKVGLLTTPLPGRGDLPSATSPSSIPSHPEHKHLCLRWEKNIIARLGGTRVIKMQWDTWTQSLRLEQDGKGWGDQAVCKQPRENK